MSAWPKWPRKRTCVRLWPRPGPWHTYRVGRTRTRGPAAPGEPAWPLQPGSLAEAVYWYRQLGGQGNFTSPEDIIAALSNLGYSWRMDQRWADAETAFRECLQLRQQHGDRAGVGQTFFDLGASTRLRSAGRTPSRPWHRGWRSPARLATAAKRPTPWATWVSCTPPWARPRTQFVSSRRPWQSPTRSGTRPWRSECGST